MKIIDILAGKEAPKKFKYNAGTFERQNNGGYIDEDGDNLTAWIFSDYSNIYEEVEIIEEEKEENEISNINLGNMKDIGTKIGKAYRELFEGLNKGWNTPLEEDKGIKKYSNDTKEDLIDLVIEKDNIIDNLQSKIDKAIKYIDLKSNVNGYDKNKLLDILKEDK